VVLYAKLILLWALVLLSDYLVEFRFEYLWPFWLFLRSVYDSFKYQGLVSRPPEEVNKSSVVSQHKRLKRVASFKTNIMYSFPEQAFSVFFIFIAVTSDMICYLFIPIHWLFFVASTYVWVQYVWHTDKGVCVQTVCLWLLFIYIEAAIRLREFKAHVDIRHLPFHLDLCRPFAAHW